MRSCDEALVHSGRGQHEPADQARALVDAGMEAIAEMGAAVLLRPAGVGLARNLRPKACGALGLAALGGDDRGVDQRAGLEDQALGGKLPVDLVEAGFEHAALGRILAEAAQRRLVGRALAGRKAAEAPERQPIEERLLELRVGQRVEPLQQKRLQHHQRLVGRATGPPGAQPRRQCRERRPVDRRADRLEPPVRPKARIAQRIRKAQLLPAHRPSPRDQPQPNHPSR